MKRTTCSACGCEDLDQFLDLGLSPVADAYTTIPGEPSPELPLQVAVCAKCKLVQLLEVVDGDTLFGTGYSFYSSASPPLSSYHEKYASSVLAKHRGLAAHGVVEIGCNDGDLLQHFAAAGCPTFGVDPASGPVGVARDRGLRVANLAFDAGIAAGMDGGAGVVIANHVLAHVEDVSSVLSGISMLLREDGVAMVEVQYLPDLLVNNAFDLVYHEHRNFFSLTSLEQAALRHGLHVVEAELTDRQGGSLRVTLQLQSMPNPAVEALRASEHWLNSFSAYDGMQGRAERIRTRLLDLLAAQKGPVAAYGAPAKLTTLISFCGLTASTIQWCVDTTRAKQNRHIPGTVIKIVAPGTYPNPGAYLLAAWNYAPSIMAANPGNRWILAIPAPTLL